MTFRRPMAAHTGYLAVYASESPSGTAVPGVAAVPAAGQWDTPSRADTAGHMVEARPAAIPGGQESWAPWTSAIWNRWLPPRPPRRPWESPLEFDTAEKITRQGTFPSHIRPFPYPPSIGAISGFWELQDVYSRAWAYARNAYGPGTDGVLQRPPQITYPTLQKRTG